MDTSKNIGIWIDTTKAMVVSVNGKDGALVRTIESNIESQVRIPGEGKESTRMGKQFIDNESTIENRRKHDLKSFFQNVKDAVKHAEAIVIVGPAEAKTGLHKLIQADNSMAGKVVKVEAADSMTDNQVVALLKSYFSS